MTNKIRTNNFRLINAGFPKTASKSCSEGIAKNMHNDVDYLIDV